MIEHIYIQVVANGKTFDNTWAGGETELVAHIDNIVNEHMNDNSEFWCKFRKLFNPKENGSYGKTFIDTCMRIANEAEDYMWDKVGEDSEPDDRETGFVGYHVAEMEMPIYLDEDFDLKGNDDVFGKITAQGTEDIDDDYDNE